MNEELIERPAEDMNEEDFEQRLKNIRDDFPYVINKVVHQESNSPLLPSNYG
jgi:hypothetical protein